MPKSFEQKIERCEAAVTTLQLGRPSSTGRAVGPRVVVLSGAAATEIGRVVQLDGRETIFGRSDGVTVSLEDHGISRRHAAITRTDGSFRIADLASRNGTFVNGIRISETTLRDGDRIQLGTATLLHFASEAGDAVSDLVRSVVTAGGVGVWDWDPESDEIAWSEHVDRALRLPEGTLSNARRSLGSLVHADDWAHVRQALRSAAVNRTPFEEEFRLQFRDFVRWVLCRGELRILTDAAARISGTVVDVTGPKQREVELRRAGLMFESFADGVFLTDSTGIVLDCNTAAEGMFGLRRDDARGANVFERIGVRDGAAMTASACGELSGTHRWTAELLIPTEAAPITCEVLAFPLRNEATEILGAAFLFRDVSERKKLQAQLASAERMASLGTLSAGVAHEINNPLAYVLANVEFCASEIGRFEIEDENRSAVLDALTEAREGAARIAGVVRDLKAFSREDESAMAGPTDVRRSLEAALKLASVVARHRARVETRFEDVSKAIGVESKLTQVFVNLLVNAAQAIPESRSDGRILVALRQESADTVLVEVADNGCGMSPDVLARIFDPFFTTKDVGVGTGLGLSICHGLVQSFGASLRAESEPGSGSTFQLRLRVAEEAEESSMEQPSLRSGASVRVLVVDDEPLLTTALGRALKDHAVRTANDAREALMVLAEGARFDVIVCDLQMPEMNGMDLYREISARWPEMAERFLFLTGGATTAKAGEFLAGLARNRKLMKPVNGWKLERAIAGVLGGG